MSTLAARLASLPPEHRQALEWFWSRRGELTGWPEPLDGLFLVNRPKGIHKPKGWRHALSVRQALNGPYVDRPVVGDSHSAWTYDYFQEGLNPGDRDKYATNRGLLACWEDDVPVAVLIQEKGKPSVQYRVRGLAKVTGWNNGHFKLHGYDAAGELPEATSPLTVGASDDYSIVSSTVPEMAEPGPPMDLADARKRIDAQIVARQGGKAFRSEALSRFNGRCAISGWTVVEVLEAAHIVPYLGLHTNEPDNALLLRSDLHTLFDRGLLSIDPDTRRVKLAGSLVGGPYEAFAGAKIALPTGVSAETIRSRLTQRTELMKPAID